MKLFRLNSLLLFSLLLILGGCHDKNKTARQSSNAASSKVASGTLRVNITGEPQTLDPRKARSLNDVNVIKMLMEGLTRVNEKGEPDLALAERYQVSDDQKVYTFSLRRAKWSNGETITAQDFLYTWKKTLSPEFPSDNANMLYIIKNAKLIKEGKLPSSMLGVKALDEFTLQIQLEKPVPYFFEVLSYPIFFPVHAATDRENSSWALEASTFVSSGPFKIKSWKHQNMIEAVKNDKYWDFSAVKLSSVHMSMVDSETGFKMFENKELDWEGSPLSLIPQNAIPSLKEKNILNASQSLGTFFIRTNTTRAPLSNSNMRKALALAINRQEIVDHITHGQLLPANSLIPKSMNISEDGYFKDADSASAKSYIQTALQSQEISQKDLNNLTLIYYASDKNHAFAQAIQNQWKETLGLDVKLEALDAKILFDRLSKKDYLMAIGSWIADFKDPINFLEVFKNKEVGTNNTNWENQEYTSGLEESYLKSNKVERQELLSHCESILMNEMPIIPICHFSMLYVKDDKVQNVVLTNTGSIDFKWANVGKN